MRFLASILLGLACGFAFLLLAGATVLSGIAAFVTAWLLAAIFNEALGAHYDTSRPGGAARVQDSSCGSGRAER